MSEFKLKVKDAKEFIDRERMMYAHGAGKGLYVRLKAGPNVERYIVKVGDKETGFTKLSDAVRLFNNS